jgi:hypothetical protein
MPNENNSTEALLCPAGSADVQRLVFSRNPCHHCYRNWHSRFDVFQALTKFRRAGDLRAVIAQQELVLQSAKGGSLGR